MKKKEIDNKKILNEIIFTNNNINKIKTKILLHFLYF